MTSLEHHSVTFIKDLINERVGHFAVLSAIQQLAFALEEHPDIWGWGDGYGGWVKQVIETQITSRGLPWEPVRQPNQRDPLKLLVLERDDYTCRNCGIYDEHCHVDHILPRSRGGTNKPDNLQALCAKCNSSKGAMTMEEWEASGRAAKRRGEA